MDDFVVNVRQIGNYPQLQQLVTANDLLLVQQGGLGGPYACITQDGLLGNVFQRLNVGILPAPDNVGISTTYMTTPLGQRQGFNWYYDEDGIQRYLQNGPAGYWSMVNTAGDLVWAVLPPGEKDNQIDPTQWDVIFDLTTSGQLTVGGIAITGGGTPGNVATIPWVQANTVASFNSRIGAVTLSLADVTGAGGAPLASPALSGTPTAPTATAGVSTTQIATTAYVVNTINAAIAAEILVSSFNGRSGVVTLTAADVSGVGAAMLASPTFTGTPAAPTAAPGTSSTQIATTAFVATNFVTTSALTAYAPLTSPAFGGVPTAPTATAGTNTTQLATTQFVQAAVVASTTGVASFNTRTGAVTLSAADITGAGGALLAGPTFTGVPAAPTATPGTSTTQLATTAFVAAAVTAAGGVTTFNTRSGAVTLVGTDITNAGGALLAGPTFTGVPAAPTASPGTSTTQLATTAFVAAAITASVVSFNGRTGTVTLTATDITNAGGALLAGPAFTGVPTAPTAAPGTSTTQLATTAFVQAYVPTSIQSSTVQASPADFSAGITLASTDNGTIKICTAASAVTVTCPNSLAKDFYCTVVQFGAGQITFAAGTGATLHNRQGLLHSAGQYAVCCLIVCSNAGGTAASFVLGGDVA